MSEIASPSTFPGTLDGIVNVAFVTLPSGECVIVMYFIVLEL